ncbi:prolyl-tRNA synthetase associated domain-containing protein [Candidatus Peregrinibacteria bacterium]|jgi:Ala-tRNA(Pro) deacylase|nr:prolyl-tRNA synthetase associated domain-containing protein [Candidatus Peregrinibacteria bacterium]MBT7484377.1 prolyl-tRNA synthetase associated domain-containing protein [Candidatus Peregrinibacteria bacterium]MBT7703800.1 prolyl-tRNA synthetase associated domain-containing protein [Candidatus Peregrinibacteria bacterium]
MTNVQQFLEENNIEYILHKHPAVFTCEEAEKHCGNIPGLPCKNLVLKDGKKNFFMVILPAVKRLDFKKIAQTVEAKKVSFASAEALDQLLGLEVGSVSPFGLLNDQGKKVRLFIDEEVVKAKIVSFHPNVNTATLELRNKDFFKFLEAIKCKPQIICF